MSDLRVLDTHTHFYDPARPQGVPWPRADEALLYRTVLPRHWRRLADEAGVAGTVVVEASGWIADNDWILDLADNEPGIVGFIGHIEPGESFERELGRLAARPLFRGIRLGAAHLEASRKGPTLRALELLARRGLALDLLVATGALGLAADAAERVPGLSVVIDHLGGVRIDGGSPPQEWLDGMARLAALPGVACKVSGYVEAASVKPGPAEPSFYRPVFDAVLGLFGPKRLLFGSNWPVCELGGSYAGVLAIARELADSQGPAFPRLFFAGNAARSYGIEVH